MPSIPLLSVFLRVSPLCALIIVTAVSATPRENMPVRFYVSTPENEAGPEQIFVSFGHEGWPESGRALKRIEAGLYGATFEFPAGSELNYKFVREQSWKSVEKDPRGEEIANRFVRLPTAASEFVVFHHVARWADRDESGRQASFQRAVPTGLEHQQIETTRTGDIRVHPTIFSEKLNSAREVHVYVPPGYDAEPNERYPVLYMQDGQNLFDTDTAFAGVEWRLDETCERLIRSGKIQKIIVVGIYNTRDRIREYTPFADEKHGGGDADRYLEFVIKTVKPFIDKTYRTKPDRASTAIGGSSLGGLLSLYAVWKHADVFSRAAVVSPSLQWADEAIFRLIRETKPPADCRIWIDTGTAEGESDEMRAAAVARCERLADLLKSLGLLPEKNFHYASFPGATHHEAAWSARADKALIYLFGK